MFTARKMHRHGGHVGLRRHTGYQEPNSDVHSSCTQGTKREALLWVLVVHGSLKQPLLAVFFFFLQTLLKCLSRTFCFKPSTFIARAVDTPAVSAGLGWFVCLLCLSMTEEMRLNICHHSEESGHSTALCVTASHVHRFPNLVSSTAGLMKRLR